MLVAANDDVQIQRKLVIFTGLLAFVGFLQFFALVGQVVIYCRQARIMQQQANIQAAGMRQWVDVGSWEIYPSEPPHYAIGQGRLVKKPETVKLKILFKVINNTERPVTILSISTKVHVAGGRNCNEFTINEQSVVAPKGGTFTTITPVALIGGEVDRYILESVIFDIFPRIVFEDAMRQHNEQSLEQVMECNVHGSLPLANHVKTAAERRDRARSEENPN